MNYDFKTSPLIYDKTKIDNVSHIKNILLISQSINDYNVLVSACNEDILYSLRYQQRQNY